MKRLLLTKANLVRGLVLVSLLGTTASAWPAVVGGYGIRGTIADYFVYPGYGDGDVTFSFSANIAGWTGFWLKRSDPGYKEAFTRLVMAYASKATLEVWAYDDSLWSGSGSPYCRVYALRPVS